MNFEPLISVIIPTYKSDITLLRAVDSVLTQSYTNIEAIVVDDNDPASEARVRTESLMQKYKNNPKVKYIKHSKNRNGSAARNTAFKNSTGKFIAFLDDDDYFLEDYAKTQLNYMETHTHLGGCYCWRNEWGKDVCGKYNGNLTKQILTLEFTPCTSCLFIRRECYVALNGFDESFRRHQDFEFLLRYFKLFELEYVPSVQVVKSYNGINNVPKGQALIDLKEHFFNQFKEDVEFIRKNDLNTWKIMMLNHYVPVFKDLIRFGYPILAVHFYFKHCMNLGFTFWLRFFNACLRGQLSRLKKYYGEEKNR